ncbi:MAG: trimeric intracellular cation channel family protein [Candidatus Micrarchaeia archaeon]
MIIEALAALDVIGVISFAFVGVQKARAKNLDVFGAVLLGVLTPIGGGVVRDFINNTVPYAFANQWYLATAILAASFFTFLSKNGWKIPKKLVLAGDTIGLGAFAVVGATVGISAQVGILSTIVYAVLTATFGGLLSDVLVNNVSFVLNRQVYASAAALGATATFLTVSFGTGAAIAIGFISTIATRTLAIKYNLNLPRMK